MRGRSLTPNPAPVENEFEHSKLYNADLAPVPFGQRKWRLGSIAALWISMSACIPTYRRASSRIEGGRWPTKGMTRSIVDMLTGPA